MIIELQESDFLKGPITFQLSVSVYGFSLEDFLQTKEKMQKLYVRIYEKLRSDGHLVTPVEKVLAGNNHIHRLRFFAWVEKPEIANRGNKARRKIRTILVKKGIQVKEVK
jgi:hypothetical protein